MRLLVRDAITLTREIDRNVVVASTALEDCPATRSSNRRRSQKEIAHHCAGLSGSIHCRGREFQNFQLSCACNIRLIP